MAFSWFSRPKNNTKTLGVTLGAEDGVKAELDKMQGAIKKTSRTYQDDIKKYKDIAKFNQHLTKSYVANLKVIVDVSELLNSYSSVFISMKDEFAKMDTAVGRPLELSDFEYLENLTKAKMEDLNLEFAKQTEGLKKLYTQYGRAEELNRILVAKDNVDHTVEDATLMLQRLKGTTPKSSPNTRKDNIVDDTNKNTVITRSYSNSNSNSNSNSRRNSVNSTYNPTPLKKPLSQNVSTRTEASSQAGGKKRTPIKRKPLPKKKKA